MRRVETGLAAIIAATLLVMGCQQNGLVVSHPGGWGGDPAFGTDATRPVRREGGVDDRTGSVAPAVAASAWMTIVKRRTPFAAAEVLVVAGGGGGGGSTAGGGGGGGVLYQTPYTLNPSTVYPVTVGAGGLGGQKSNDGPVSNTSGGNSTFDTLTALGGGYGASGKPAGSRHASPGGSGGGGGYYSGDDLIPINNAAGTGGQGFAGGVVVGTGTAYWGGGGGGGAGGPGGNFNRDVAVCGGNGGPGMSCPISGALSFYGGGGGGGMYLNGSTLGGIGGGGNGADGQTCVTTAGTPGTGGGGGAGGWYQFGVGGSNGGSGIVIIRYLGGVAATGGAITSVGGYTIHTFTSSGTFST